MTNPLPPRFLDQNCVTVSPLAGGFITLPEVFFVKPADEGVRRTVPSLAFLITHPGTQLFGADERKPLRVMFDLGLRKSRDRYPEPLRNHLDGRAPSALEPGLASQLRSGGLDPREVDLIILSHVHYDHHGDPEDFPKAEFRIGHGTMNVLKHGLGEEASHQYFQPDILPADRSSEFPDPMDTARWKPLGPFPAALDLLEDGSIYVVDMPGHLPGHTNLLCRTNDRWLLLCGDAFHDKRLLTGEKQIATWEGQLGTTCIHVDREAAAESIARLREFDRLSGDECELIAAHDAAWWEENKSSAFPSTI